MRHCYPRQWYGPEGEGARLQKLIGLIIGGDKLKAEGNMGVEIFLAF